jgi:hypothetical protein
MTGGLGTNPHLPGTTGILGNCTAPSNTLLQCKHYGHWASITHCILDCQHLPQDLLSYSVQSNIVLLSIQPLLGPGESIAHSMHTLPVMLRLVGKASIDLTIIVVAFHWSSPLVDTMGWQTVVMSLEITSWVVVKSLW